jgi:hypothetical protein
VIRIVYGSRTDWVKNVLASGAAAIVQEAHTYSVDRPEIVPIESVIAYFPSIIQRIDRVIRTDQCLRVRRDPAANMSGPEGVRRRAMKQQSEDQVIRYPKARRFMEEAIPFYPQQADDARLDRG